MQRRRESWVCAVVAAGSALLASCADVHLDFIRRDGGGEEPADVAETPDASIDEPQVPDAEEASADAPFDVLEEPFFDGPRDARPDAPLTPCTDDLDCSGNTPHCNPKTGFCFTCETDENCGIGMKCNTNIPKCARACTAGSQCPTGVCDTSATAGYCVDCVMDNDCAGGQTCIYPQGLCTSQ